MTRIDFRHVSKRYAPGGPLAIRDARIEIDSGEFCVFIGPSGCGKSTLLRMVAGLEEISEGDLLIGGARVNDVPPARRGVAMVFQSYALYPHMTVRENMAFGLLTLGGDRAAVEAKVKLAADILQLTPLLERLPRQLSGGQRQRVAIGRAIVKEPRVFLFDEPLSNLDAGLRVQTRLEIAKLHHDLGTASMIYVTHDQVEAMTLADKIVLLHAGAAMEERGSVAQIGSPMALYHRPASRFVAEFIGSPKMNILPGRLLRADAGYAEVEIAGRSVRAAVDATHLPAGAEVQVGVRPEHVVLGEGARAAELPACLRHVERLGDASLLYAQGGAGLPTLTVRCDGAAAQAPGAALRIGLLPQHLHLFDAAGDACRRTVDLPH